MRRIEINDRCDELIGLKIKTISEDEESVNFETECGREFVIEHTQECCEGVYIEDINGDIEKLVGEVITKFEIVSDRGEPGIEEDGYTPSSYEWTFIHISTINRTITIRFYGTSNGYYSESADLYEWV